MFFNVYYIEYSPSLLLPDRFGGKVASLALSNAPDWWISSFKSSNISSLSARMLSLMNETPPPPHGPIGSAGMGTIRSMGVASAPQQPISFRVLFWLFQLFFIHKKERERGRERKRGKKGLHS